MYKKHDDKFFLRILITLLAIIMILKVFVPIIKPAKLAYERQYVQENFYKEIIDKSNMSMAVMMDDEDEEKKDLIQIVFKYITNIDLDNPKSYLASQIPILQSIDIKSLVASEDYPVVVVPKEDKSQGNNEVKNDNQGMVNNKDTLKDSEIRKIAVRDSGEVKKKKYDPKKPLVLIYHTHTTENYNPNNLDKQNFSTNLNMGVCKVGERLKNELENTYGISVIHDMTVHDVPKREGAYAKSRPTVQKYLKNYPGLKIIIDLHRDGGVKRNISTAIIKNDRYARVMFVVGTKYAGYTKNMVMSERLNNTLKLLYPEYSRGMTFSKRAKYNQDLSNKIVLIEVGSNENSLDEALNAAKIIANVIAKNIN